MAQHTLINEIDIRIIANRYRINVKDYTPIEGGEANSSFLLDSDDERYILTICDGKSLGEVDQLSKVLIHLANHSYLTSRVCLTTHGTPITKLYDKPVMLKTWLPGTTLRDQEQDNYRPIGKAIAQLHNIPVPDGLPDDHPYGLANMSNAIGQGIDREYEHWLANKINYLSEYLPTDLPRGLIHGDLFADNILYHQGESVAIIDFEDTCNYYLAYDLGSALFGSCIKEGKLDFKRSRELICGYQGLRRLTERERIFIQFFTVYAGTAISAWHYLAYNVYHPEKKKRTKHAHAVRVTEHIFNIPKDEFLGMLD
jgi:homoserine kinase type II